MELFWQKSFGGDIKISDVSNTQVGSLNFMSHDKINDHLFYTEQNTNLDTLIISQDVNYNRLIAIYRQEYNYLGFVKTVTLKIHDQILTFIYENKSSAYLEQNKKIIASYTSNNGWLRQSGTISILDFEDNWPIILYSLLFAIKSEEDSNTSA